MFSSLDRMDIELDSVGGRRQLMQTDHRNAEESTVIAMTRDAGAKELTP